MKKWVALTLALLMMFTVTGCAPKEEAYPSGTIKVIVPFGAGGDTDLAARIITDKLPDRKYLDCTDIVAV